jgi:hypothetical protein
VGLVIGPYGIRGEKLIYVGVESKLNIRRGAGSSIWADDAWSIFEGVILKGKDASSN